MFIRSKQYYPVTSGNYISDSTLISSNSRQSDFCTRLCVETDYTYKLGGVVCLITLTYNDVCLPHAFNPATSERFPCFSRADIRKFLNLLKVRMYRANVIYKYFLCCEFGDNTKRPHYHLLGFLHNKEHIKIFLDTIREIWSYGIVFPAPYGNPYAASVLRSPRNGAAYASKYVCKDLSFWSLPALKRYVEYINKQTDFDYISKLKDALPRLYQSNGIGEIGLNQFTDFNKLLKDGFFNPLTKKFTKIPNYLINKYLYSFAPAFDSRVGMRGNKLYDRFLKASPDDLCAYKLSVYDSYLSKVNSLLNSSVSSFDFQKFNSILAKVTDNLRIDNSLSVSYLCRYISFVRMYSSLFVEQFFDFKELFDFDVIREYITLNADTLRRYSLMSSRCYSCSVSSVFPEYQEVISSLDTLASMLDTYFTAASEKRISDQHAAWALSRKLKKPKYDTKLC